MISGAHFIKVFYSIARIILQVHRRNKIYSALFTRKYVTATQQQNYINENNTHARVYVCIYNICKNHFSENEAVAAHKGVIPFDLTSPGPTTNLIYFAERYIFSRKKPFHKDKKIKKHWWLAKK